MSDEITGINFHKLGLEVTRLVFQACLGQRLPQIPLWDGGVRDVAAAKLEELGVKDRPTSFVEIARYVGVLGPDPNVIDIPNSRFKTDEQRRRQQIRRKTRRLR